MTTVDKFAKTIIMYRANTFMQSIGILPVCIAGKSGTMMAVSFEIRSSLPTSFFIKSNF